METTKLRIRLGGFEIDFEGSEEFLKAEVPAIVSELTKVTPHPLVQVLHQTPTAAAAAASGPSAPQFDFSTNTIASLTDAKTGPDLAMAAAAHLTLIKGQDKFLRRELLEEMQSATTFYNQGYSGNLSKILNNLTKARRLNLVGNNTYALTRAEREAFAGKLKQET